MPHLLFSWERDPGNLWKWGCVSEPKLSDLTAHNLATMLIIGNYHILKQKYNIINININMINTKITRSTGKNWLTGWLEILTAKLLLALASTVILGSESHGIRNCPTALGAFRLLSTRLAVLLQTHRISFDATWTAQKTTSPTVLYCYVYSLPRERVYRDVT
jgi:hypothetical protein